MKITQVRSFLLSYAFREPIRLPFYGGERTILKRDAMLIRVDGEKGLRGYGPGPGSEKTHAAIQSAVTPFLEGRSTQDLDALRAQFLAGPGRDPNLAKVYGAVEIALYDLAAKEKGVPVSELLGGRVRDRIRLYGSAGMYMPPEKYAEEAAAIAGLGFRGYKMRPALGPERDLKAVRLMRKAVGPNVELMVDAHTWWRMGDLSYDFATIERLARELAAERAAWLEEPMPPDEHEAYRRMRGKKILPLASGEHEQSEERYLDLIRKRCVDYVQMDVFCQGGYALARRLFQAIAEEGLKFAFHSWGTMLEVMAAAHVGICQPESVVEWLEFPCYSGEKRPGMYAFPAAEEILKAPLEIRDGELIVPRTPGLGVEVDESVLDRYPWIPGPWSYFRIDSPPELLAVTSDHSIQWEGKTAK
jgi:L-alanine-DL-glutamate epimerase-like enolase superfamily enzyme